MGIDRIEQARKPVKFSMSGARIWLPLDMLQGAAYAGLTQTAKALLLDLSAQLRSKHGDIINNGDLTTALSVLTKCGWKDEKTIRKAATQLVDASLIVKTRQGHRPNTATLYAVTWLPLNEMNKLDISARGFPLYGYRLLDKLPPLKLNRDPSKIPNPIEHRGVIDISNHAVSELDPSKTPLCDDIANELTYLKHQASIITNTMNPIIEQHYLSETTR
jgi:hypothetical protein